MAVDSAFFSSFWPSFWAGLGANALTGAVIGFGLYFVQRAIENRVQHRIVSGEYLLKINELSRDLILGHDLIPGVALQAVSPAVVGAVKVIDSAPLGAWVEIIPDRSEEINMMLGLKQAYLDYVKLAVEFDRLTSMLVRNYNHGRGLPVHNDLLFHSVVVGMLFGFSYDEIIPWLEGISPPAEEKCDEVWGLVQQESRLVELIPLLVAARHAAYSSADALLIKIQSSQKVF